MWSCDKKYDYTESAQIIGYDGTMCGCCGGYMVKSSEDYSMGYYLARTLPSSAGISPTSSFPINVEINYTKDDKTCDKVITVIHLTRK